MQSYHSKRPITVAVQIRKHSLLRDGDAASNEARVLRFTLGISPFGFLCTLMRGLEKFRC
jgi:hypothetical protein